MTSGRFRDGFARVPLALPLRGGGERRVEFVVDSGFEGDLSAPPALLSGLDVVFAGELPFLLADLTYRERPVYQMILDWQGEELTVEVIGMDGNPLLGVGLLRGNAVHMEMEEGGEVAVEPL